MCLPGGRGLIFRVRRAGQAPSEFDIMGMTLPKGEARPLIRGILSPLRRLRPPAGQITADGKLLRGSLRHGEGRPQRGSPVALLEGLRSGSFELNLAVCATGTLVYA